MRQWTIASLLADKLENMYMMTYSEIISIPQIVIIWYKFVL